MSFEELLKQAGLDQYQQYFGQTGQEVAGALGFEGQQAEQFARFFSHLTKLDLNKEPKKYNRDKLRELDFCKAILTLDLEVLPLN